MERVCYAITGRYEVLEEDQIFSYGVCARLGNGDFCTVDNISTSRNKIEKLIDFLVRNEISFVHFSDVIEDFLAE